MNKGLIFLIAFLLLSLFGGFYFTGKYLHDSFEGDLVASIDEGIIVLYSSFKGKGDTTNFLIMSDNELENISNLILEDTNYGKIRFQENINLTKNFIQNF